MNLDQLKNAVRDVQGLPPPPASTVIRDRDEPARVPVRAHLAFCAVLLSVGALGLAWLVGNPLANVQDSRLATQYNKLPLTCLAARPGLPQVWLGTEGAGIGVFDPKLSVFLADLNRKTTGKHLLADHILALDFDPNQLAAIAASNGRDQPGGAQIATLIGTDVRFWPKPCVGLDVFPKLHDEIATCVAESADHNYVIIGTRGEGLGVYHVPSHAWTSILTTEQGLPSNNITDLATIRPAVKDSAVWVATDKGICAGILGTDGRLDRKWKFGLKEGLAGEQIRRLVFEGGYIWYLTEGRGLGRIRVTAMGAPDPNEKDASELLVSERRLDGIADKKLRLARGSPAGPTTWFLAEDGKDHVLGRYREAPHDTTGIRLPAEFPFRNLTCMATDAETGRSALIGTQDGAWLYRERLVEPSGSNDITYNSLSAITGGAIGPVGQPVEEAALSERTAVIKTRAPGQPPALQDAWLRREGGNSDWQTLVGPGRFPKLAGGDEITSAARNGEVLYFGTSGKGIGVWDRARLEVRRELHSTETNPEKRLRNDTTLDLASLGNHLFQVTGDHAVDYISANGNVSLVPPGSAPFEPQQLASATAKGTLFVGASADRIAVYDMGNFTWREAPSLRGVKRLELTNGALWAQDERGQLFAALSPFKEWKKVIDNVRQIATSPERIFVLVERPGSLAALHAFDGMSAEPIFQKAPVPLGVSRSNWRFAAVFGGDLLFAGEARELHRYRLAERNWDRIRMPDQFVPPLVAARRTAQSWWLLDSASHLHRYNAAGGDKARVEPDIDTATEKFAAAGSRVVVLRKKEARGARVVEFDDDATPHVLVGRAFTGDLSHPLDVVEWNGRLVVAAGAALGVYDPATHDWTSIATPGPIQRVHVADPALWVQAGGELFTLTAEFALLPVTHESQPITAQQIAAGSDRLWILEASGRVLTVAAAAPDAAQVRLEASALPGGRPSAAGIVGDQPIVRSGGAFYQYSSYPGHWRKRDCSVAPTSFATDRSGTNVVGWNETGAWIIQGFGSSADALTVVPLIPPAQQSGAKVLTAIAGAEESACAFEVRGEQGLQVALSRGGLASAPVIGGAFRGNKATRKVVQDPDSGALIRLDTGGNVGAYDPARRHWNTDSIQLDDIWVTSGTVFGSAQKTQTLYQWRNGAWKTMGESVSQVLHSPEAIVFGLKNGTWNWVDADRAVIMLHSPVVGRSGLGTIAQAAEWKGQLLLRDTAGNLAAYHPGERRWRALTGRKVHAFVRRPGSGEVALIFDNPKGKRQLALPLVSDPTELSISFAFNIAAPMQSAVAGDTQLFGLTDDGALYRLANGPLRRELPERKWSGIYTDGHDVFACDPKGWHRLNVSGDIVGAVLLPLDSAPPAPLAADAWLGKGWEFADKPENGFVRLFSNGVRLDAKLTADGFPFDRVHQVFLDKGRAVLASAAGLLAMAREGAGFTVTGIEPGAPATAMPQETATLLQTNDWTWSASTAGAAGERVVRRVDGREMEWRFDPATGRFDVDTCLALGSDGVRAWILTHGGLACVADGTIEKIPDGLDPRSLSFLPGSGDQGAALADASGNVRLAFDGNAWRTPDAETTKRLRTHVAIGKTWRLLRSGDFEHVRPQDPGEFSIVQLPGGRWDFETVTHVAAAGSHALLVTQAGPGALAADEPGLAALWPKQVAIRFETAGAKFDGTQWLGAADDLPPGAAPKERTGTMFHFVRAAGTLELKLSPTAKLQPARSAGGRFSFDQVTDAAPLPSGAALATADGLATRAGDGLGLRFTPETAATNYEFVIDPEDDAVFAAAGDDVRKYDGKQWSTAPAASLQAARKRAKESLVSGDTWRIGRRADSALEFALHLPDDAGGEYKTVSFDDRSGAFAFDVFLSLAPPQANGDGLLGSAGGVQRFSPGGKLERLWCEPGADGIAAVPVVEMARGEDGTLLARSGTQVLAQGPEETKFKSSTAEALQAAHAIRAADPKGWRVEQLSNQTLRIEWRQEPVFLVSTGAGRTRFAHNVVHAIAASGSHLLLGTEGGLVRLEPTAPGSAQILVRPFSPAGALPDAFDWMAVKGKNLFARAHGGAIWSTEMSTFRAAAAAALEPAEVDAMALVGEDDLLAWRHPKAGTIKVSFKPDRTVPATLEPMIAGETFTFLNLEIASAANPPATLCQTPAALFWLTQAGIMQFDSKTRNLVKLHARTGDDKVNLITATALHWDVLGGVVSAGNRTAEAEFDGKVWKPRTGQRDPFEDLSLVGDSRLLEWRQQRGSVRIGMKSTDVPKRDFFGRGRPLLDEVNDLAFQDDKADRIVSLATDGGVADYAAGDFAWKGLAGLAFADKPVIEIAAALVDGKVQRCCRCELQDFEQAGADWKPAKDVVAVFEANCERVHREGYWSWSRRANGLTCTFLNTNGAPFRTGIIVDRPPIFSRGKMALDDVHGAVLNGEELLLAGPLGVARHRLDPFSMASEMTGLDTWLDEGDSAWVGAVTGILHDRDDFVIWREKAAARLSSGKGRVWNSTQFALEALARRHRIDDAGRTWMVSTPGTGNYAAVTVGSGARGTRWYTRTRGGDLHGAAVSGEGLWFIQGNELFHASARRATTSPLNYLPVGASFEETAPEH